MFRYFTRLYEKYALPVYPIALFSYDAPHREEPSAHRVAFPDLQVLDFSYRVIQLNRLNWRDFMRRQNPVASALMAKMGIAPEDRPRVKLECLRLLATLRLDPARTHLISGFIDTYLRLTAAEMQIFQAELEATIPPQQERVMKIVTSWMEEGIQQGEANLLVRQINRRFGPIAPDLETRIRSLTSEQLNLLSDELFDFTTLADILNWLDRPAPAGEAV
jgi:hypothetical protein